MIQLLFKLLFELLDANSKFLLKHWSIYKTQVRISIALQTGAGYLYQDFVVNLDSKEPAKEIAQFIADVKSEFIEQYKGKEETDDSCSAN